MQEIQVVRFSPEHLPALEEFSKATWDRPRTVSYFRWRYLAGGPVHRQWLALRGSECLAVISAFPKRYLLGQEPVTIIEPFDWYCRPGLKGGGIGGPLMRAVMEEPEPSLVCGGTVDTLSRLPHMQWQVVGEIQSFDLPVGSDLLAAAASRRLRIPRGLSRAAAALAGPCLYGPRKFAPPPATERFAAAILGNEILDLYADRQDSSLIQIPDPELFRWITSGYSGLGHFLPLYFHDQQRLRGFSLSRVMPTRQGLAASILDLYWPGGDVAVYSWMISESVSCLLSFRPQRIMTGATSPVLQEALRRNRFRVTGRIPVHIWGKGRDFGKQPIELTYNYADWPLLPYPGENVGRRFLLDDGPAPAGR